MGDIVIVAYRPEPGCAAELLNLVREHVPLLQRLGLATYRQAQTMKAKDATMIEVFEWEESASAKVPENSHVQGLWEKLASVCEHVPLREMPVAAGLFAEFTPLDD